ncbi:sensor histidine kinase [Nonomuraea terrae]|uniref:sensor histidine kinase n=1 Tax=Nonomuraea terrae TaxID=2530383 RepID=UPI0037964EF9
MIRALARIVPFVLRGGAVALLIIAQVRSAPAPGPTGPGLAVAVVTGALAVTLLAIAFRLPLRGVRRPSQGTANPAPDLAPEPLEGSHPTEPPQPTDGTSLLTPGHAPERSTEPLRGSRREPSQDTKDPSRAAAEVWRGAETSHPAPELSRGGADTSQAAPEPSPRTARASRLAAGLSKSAAKASVFGVPLTLVALGLAVILSDILFAISRDGAAVGALLFCVTLVATRFPLRQSMPVGILAVGGLLVVGVLDGFPAQDLTAMLSVCMIFLIAYAARQRKAARAAEAREAVLAERARIARELHDILAHSLSAQLVHLEGAKLLLRAERTAEALDRVTRARDLAKSGLDEARRAVSALRESPPPLPEALRALTGEFESATQQECALRVRGLERRLAPETELTLIRTAQEALTNVRRHAPGSPATVELSCDRSWCDLRVTNPFSDGEGSPGGGHGLMGMRERAELLGGTLMAGERDGSFLVHLRVPA